MKEINKSKINIYEPFIAKNQKKYLKDCINTNQIGQGKYIEMFEDQLAKYLNIKNIITTSNGSVSLQLILFALKIGFGDEVITSSLTYAATVSSINILGAKAVLVDCDNNLQMDIDQVESCITKNTKAVMIPQLYGDAPDMNKLVDMCKKHNIYLIEDSAEVFGCSINEKKLGTFGIASSFSTFANKTITTFEGGFIATDDDNFAKKIKLLRSQSHISNFTHDGPGFNARLTNFQCAIGLAQLEDFNKIIKKKKRIADFYRKHLSNKLTKLIPSVDSAEWMPVFLFPNNFTYSSFSQKVIEAGIDIRPIFKPIHLMSGFNIDCKSSLDNSSNLYKNGFNLPSYPNLTNNELKYICDTINNIIERNE